MEIKTRVLTNPQHLEPSRRETARKNIAAIGKIKVSPNTHLAPPEGSDELDLSEHSVPTPDASGKILKSSADGKYSWETPYGIEQVPADWDQVDGTKPDFIKNKPGLYRGATDEHPGSSGFVPAALSDERDLFLKGDGTWGKPESTPGDGKLYIALGNDRPADTGFSANATNDTIVSIPEAASATEHEAAHGGLMTTDDKTKLDGITELLNDGTTGQVLTKTASGNEWADAPKELPTSGSAGQFLKKTANGVEYASVNEVPSGGTTGQVLTKTASGEAWADAPKELPTSGTAGQFLKKTENGVEYASVSEVPSGGTTGQVLIKTANGVEWGNSEVVKFTGTLNPDAVPPDYSGMPSATDVKAAIQAGKHVILSLDDTTGHPVQYFYTHSHGDFDFYFVGFPRMNAEGTPIYNRTYISAVNTIQSGPDSMGWTANKYLFADWPLNDGGNPTGNAGDVLTIIADKWGTKSMTWTTPSAELPSGGTNGQVLTKTASGNEWANAPTELPSSGTAGQFLKKTENGVEYASVSEVPSGGTTGQVLTKTANGETWADVPKELPTSGTAGQFLKKTENGVEYDSVNQVPSSGTTGHVLRKTASGYDFESVNEVPAEGTTGQVLTKTENGFEWSAAPTELPSSTQFDKDKVLVRTETGYDWKYVVPLRWFANKPDDASLEIDNNSYRNVIIDSVNNITFNVTTSSTHDFPNFVIDIHIDPNASIETLKINVTWTINATEHAGVETLHCPVTGNTLTVLPGEYYQLCVVGQCWRIDKFIEPPSEGVEYVILQNFISGHSIGTPDNGQWVTTVPNDWYDDLFQWWYHLSMFDDTTAGATLMDNRSPIDCSKYGISSGTPVATVTGDYGWHTDLAFSFDSGNISTPFTVETFFTCREPDDFNHNFIFYIGAAKYRPENHNELHLALKISRGLDSENPNDTHIGVYLTDEFTDDHKLLGFEPDGINPNDNDESGLHFSTWLSSWHHFAITADTTNLYVFVDGKLYASLALSTTITNENSVTKTLGEWIGLMPSKILITSFESGEGNGLCGLWTQLAVCKACKWTTDFTVPTEAY